MNPERWQRLRDIVESAEAQPPELQDAHLLTQCGSDKHLLDDARALLYELNSGVDTLAIPVRKIANLASQGYFQPEQSPVEYRIRSVLGVGGMGTVYLADRIGSDFTMPVAVKTLDSGDADDPRTEFFRAEVRNLASLSHPNIARLIDSGLGKDGSLFIVTEFVDGDAIRRHVEENRLSQGERLQLLLPVISAVQHAHNHLLLHLDIKPNNIMVDREGIPKLLDFGISAVLSGRENSTTRTKTPVGSLAYSSPEQLLGGSLGTPADVYGLGTTLYELLRGEPLLQIARESDKEHGVTAWLQQRKAIAVALADSKLDQELQSIVRKATEYDPVDRYPTVDALRADILAYLNRRPISTLADRKLYRVERFVRRNTASVSLLALLCTLSALFVASIFVQRNQLEVERDRLARERATKSAAIDFLSSTLKSVDPLATAPYTPSESENLLNIIESRARDELADTPELRAEVFRVAGDIHHSFGAYEASLELLTEAVQLLSTRDDASPEDLAVLHLYLGNTLTALGRHDEARGNYGRSLSFLDPQSSETGNIFAVVLLRRAELATLIGDYTTAEDYLNESIATYERLRIDDKVGLAQSLNSLGHLKMIQGRNEEAGSIISEAREITRETLGPKHASYGQQTARLATLYRLQGRVETAEEHFQEALEVLTEALGENHQNVMNVRTEYARLLQLTGDLDNALNGLNQSIQIAATLFGNEHYQYAIQVTEKAHVLFQQGRYEQARSLYVSSLVTLRETLPQDNAFIAVAELGIAVVEMRNGNSESATTRIESARETLRQGVGEQHWYYDYASGLSAAAVYIEKADPTSLREIEDRLSRMAQSIDSRDFRYRLLASFHNSENKK